MQKTKSKTMAILIALILTTSMGASIMLSPTASAHTPAWQIPTWAYLSTSSNPVGVGQQLILAMVLDKYPPTATLTGGARWNNYQIDVTKPDGSKETLGPFTSDPTGSTFTTFVPDQVGNYSFVFSWPGQVLTLNGPGGVGTTSVYQNDTYLGSTSKTLTVTVQQESIPSPPVYPLPTEYWTRPIDGQNTAWYSIASNWLGGCFEPQLVQPGGSAPNSPHIMWTLPIDIGGVVGGTDTAVNGSSFYSGMAYNARFTNPIIMNGKLYTTLPNQNSGTGGGVECIDLTTGAKVWVNPNMPAPAFGYYYDLEYPNQYGVIPQGILFTNNFAQAWSPTTGLNLFNVTNVPTATAGGSTTGIMGLNEVPGPQGEVLIYQINLAAGWLAEWNSSNLYTYGTGPTIASVVNASNPSMYDWNVTIPTQVKQANGTSILYSVYNDMLLGGTPTITNTGWGTANPYTMWAISLKPATRGQLMWIQNYAAPADNTSLRFVGVDPLNRAIIYLAKETGTWYAYNLDTGTLAWNAGMPGATAFAYYDMTLVKTGTAISNGKLYLSSWGGTLWCYDTANGKLLWTFGNGVGTNSTVSGLDSAYGQYPLALMAIADGKVYVGTGEHSPNTPLYKGAQVWCVNATTGTNLWQMTGWYGYVGRTASAVADGYLVYDNLYDYNIYCIGQGPSKLTVTAPDTATPVGTPIVIRGRVTDISAGTMQNEQAGDFPNGVPCVSDASQSAWMEYVYMQKPKPTNVMGVPVSIDVIDANGNYRNIGTATSDASGMFTFTWTPDIVGSYNVIATFAGSESYWPSSAESSFVVSSAAPTPAPYPLTSLPPTEMYIVGSTIAIIIAIAIVGLLVIRKRP